MLGQRRANAHTLGGTLRRGGPWGDPRGARASRALADGRALRARTGRRALRARTASSAPPGPRGQRAKGTKGPSEEGGGILLSYSEACPSGGLFRVDG